MDKWIRIKLNKKGITENNISYKLARYLRKDPNNYNKIYYYKCESNLRKCYHYISTMRSTSHLSTMHKWSTSPFNDGIAITIDTNFLNNFK